MSAAMEWRVTTDALSAILPRLAREHGLLHLAYDFSADRWIVANDAGYVARRQEAVEAIRAALAECNEQEAAP